VSEMSQEGDYRERRMDWMVGERTRRDNKVGIVVD